jgi:hypothetical protein
MLSKLLGLLPLLGASLIAMEISCINRGVELRVGVCRCHALQRRHQALRGHAAAEGAGPAAAPGACDTVPRRWSARLVCLRHGAAAAAPLLLRRCLSLSRSTCREVPWQLVLVGVVRVGEQDQGRFA